MDGNEVLLYNAVTPNCNRAEAGTRGEALFAFGERLRTMGVTVLVARNISPSDLWVALRGLIESSDRSRLVEGQFVALRALCTHARR